MADVKQLLDISEARQAAKSGRACELRRAAELSQAEIASVLGVTPSTVSRWESGDRAPRGATAFKYAELIRLLERAS